MTQNNDFAAAMEAEQERRDRAFGDPLEDGDTSRVQTVDRNEVNPEDWQKMVEALMEARQAIAVLRDERDRLLAATRVYGRVIKAKNDPNEDAFEEGDRFYVIDEEHDLYLKVGMFETLNIEEGTAICVFELPEEGTKKETMRLGLNGNGPAQVKLLGKDDGTYASVIIGSTPTEVSGVPGLILNSGDKVKVNKETLQIVSLCELGCAGVITRVKQVLDSESIVVELGGDDKVVHRGLAKFGKTNEEGYLLDKNDEVVLDEDNNPVSAFDELAEGDRVLLDSSNQVVIRHLPSDTSHSVNADLQTDWDQVGGLEDLKREIHEAIELPFTNPEIYKHYNKKRPKGILFYGPPGCGKTLSGRATANQIAKLFGKESFETGFLYVKGPEILDKYVGNSENKVGEIFMSAKKHYDKHGYPATIFIDEAESILMERGSGVSSDVEKTIVPMFLSCMDGLEESGALVILATNRPKLIDPAILREGRVDRQIKVTRPTKANADKVFEVHLSDKIPVEGMDRSEMIARAVSDIYSKNRKIYKVTNPSDKSAEHYFTFGDGVTGSMVEGIVDQATTLAIRRDIANGTKTGITAADMRQAIENTYQSYLNRNHKFDLEDYCETNNLPEGCPSARVVVKAEEKASTPEKV